MALPGGAARHACKMLESDGHVMIVPPLADDHLENNLSQIGRIYYGASTMVCVPVSLAKNGPVAASEGSSASARMMPALAASLRACDRQQSTHLRLISSEIVAHTTTPGPDVTPIFIALGSVRSAVPEITISP